MPQRPILYSFHRCPYAIRARLAIAVSGVVVDSHEVDLKAKPARMLEVSPKGTVPVLQLTDGRVIDESLDIMLWALRQNDPLGMLNNFSEDASALIERNDNQFKSMLDHYKYAERNVEVSMLHYRTQAEVILNDLNSRLARQVYILRDSISIADLALMPFIRQFAQVDRVWFDASPYLFLRAWLSALEASELFARVMQKH